MPTQREIWQCALALIVLSLCRLLRLAIDTFRTQRWTNSSFPHVESGIPNASTEVVHSDFRAAHLPHSHVLTKKYVLFIMVSDAASSSRLRLVIDAYSKWFYDVVQIGGSTTCNSQRGENQKAAFRYICFAEAAETALQNYVNATLHGLWFVGDNVIFKPWALEGLIGREEARILGHFTRGAQPVFADRNDWGWKYRWRTLIPHMDKRSVGLPAIQKFWRDDHSVDALEFKAALNATLGPDTFMGAHSSDVLYLAFDKDLLVRFIRYCRLFSYDRHLVFSEAILQSILVASSASYYDLTSKGSWMRLPDLTGSRTLGRALRVLTNRSIVFVNPIKLTHENLTAWELWLKGYAWDSDDSALSAKPLLSTTSLKFVPALASTTGPGSALQEHCTRKKASEKDRLTIHINSRFSPLAKFARKNGGRIQVPDCPVQCMINVQEKGFYNADVAVWSMTFPFPLRVAVDPSIKCPGQVWLMEFYFESPGLFNFSERFWNWARALQNSVDGVLSYRRDSELWEPYFGFKKILKSSASRAISNDLIKQKSALVLWYVSNCHEARFLWAKKFLALLPSRRVNVFGTCGKRDPCGRSNEACIRELASRHKFYLSFENARCKDYITEKLMCSYKLGLVPIVMGGLQREEYEAIAPPDSFIHVDDFSSLKALANFILRLDQDAAAYSQYLKWQSDYEVVTELPTASKTYCNICKLYGSSHVPKLQTRVRNWTQWWQTDVCMPYAQRLNSTSSWGLRR